MTITTEEAEEFARQLDANDPGVSDPVAVEFFGDVATALRTLASERDIANEQIYGLAEEREKWKERAEAAERRLFDAFRAQGKAEGKLAASEMAGVVEGWKERAESAEAEAERLREALIETTDICDQCLFEYILIKGRYVYRKEAVARARAALEGGENADQQARDREGEE